MKVENTYTYPSTGDNTAGKEDLNSTQGITLFTIGLITIVSGVLLFLVQQNKGDYPK